MCRTLAFDVAAAVLLGTRWDSETMSEFWQQSVSCLHCPLKVSQRDLGLSVQSVNSHMLFTYTVCVYVYAQIYCHVLSCMMGMLSCSRPIYSCNVPNSNPSGST